ncbi:EMC6-like membrane protein [Methanobrevibacter sp.]
MDEVQKVTTIHIVPAFFCGIISAMFSHGTFGFKNELIASLVGIVVIYLIGQYCQRNFKESIDGFKNWFMTGIMPFGFTWFIVWVLFFSYAKFIPFM